MLIVGDVMLDRYWFGTATRLSPEAPVPVVKLERVSNRLGGAANVAANVAALGAQVAVVGFVGKDEAANTLHHLLDESGVSTAGIIETSARPTTTKTRVMIHHQQMARIDEESNDELDENDAARAIERVASLVDSYDVIVISDYSKGTITASLAAQIIESALAKRLPVIVDPKAKDLRKYNGATIVTPNLSEALHSAGIDSHSETEADQAAINILSNANVESLLITLGEHGMKLYRRDAEPLHVLSTAHQVFDVTGAGDTVVAVLSAALAAGADLAEAVSLANIAAGIAVEKVGTATVSTSEIEAGIREHSNRSSRSKSN